MLTSSKSLKAELLLKTCFFSGMEFVLPVSGLYCELCDSTFPDASVAVVHCQTQEHNLKYTVSAHLDTVSAAYFQLRTEHRKHFVIAVRRLTSMTFIIFMKILCLDLT